MSNEYLIQKETLDNIVDSIRTLDGTTATLSPAQMKSNLDTFNTELGEIITTQDNLISSIMTVVSDIAPTSGAKLGTISEGAIVYINENGSPAAFYVARHHYEPDLNGVGRTLLVRKDCYDMRSWNDTEDDEYDGSSIDTWLNNDYKALLDTNVQSIIGETTFEYTNGNHIFTTISKSIFLLSYTELKIDNNYVDFNVEGSTLPISPSFITTYLNGEAVKQWTRTITNGGSVVVAKTNGKSLVSPIADSGSRPCFTLPSTAIFNKDTFEFVSADSNIITNLTPENSENITYKSKFSDNNIDLQSILNKLNTFPKINDMVDKSLYDDALMKYYDAIDSWVGNITFSGTYATETYFNSTSAGLSVDKQNKCAFIYFENGTSTSYENIVFVEDSLPSGVTLLDNQKYGGGTSGTTGVFFTAVLTGVTGKINVNVDMSTRNSTYDYVEAALTVTYA